MLSWVILRFFYSALLQTLSSPHIKKYFSYNERAQKNASKFWCKFSLWYQVFAIPGNSLVRTNVHLTLSNTRTTRHNNNNRIVLLVENMNNAAILLWNKVKNSHSLEVYLQIFWALSSLIVIQRILLDVWTTPDLK